MIAPATKEQGWHRCTGLQRAMILASLNPSSPGAYHQQLVIRLGPEIDGVLFLRAAQIYLQRHGGLMARFIMRQGELFTRRIEGVAPLGETIDLQDEPGTLEERLENYLERDRARGFDIFNGAPAWRSVLLSLGNGERAWVWSHHHALCDNFARPMSLGVLQIHDQLRDGAAVERAPASPDFFDYLRWREEQDWSATRTAWQSRFQTGDRLTALPEIRGGDPADENRDRIAVPISPETDRALRELCARFDLSLNTVVVAAWGLWLARVQDETRAVFGIMRGARKSTVPNADAIIGFFTNTVPFAVDIADAQSIGDWLRAVRSELVELRHREQCSLGEIAQWTGLEVGAEGPPSVINFMRLSLADRLQASGLAPERARVSLRQSVDVPLMIGAYESPQLRIEIFSKRNQAQAAARCLGAILSAIALTPERRVGEIDLLSDFDRALLEEAERGPRVELTETSGHALLERQIRAQPNSPALQQGTRVLTFAQLSEIADQVVQSIAASGLTSGVVAVILPPGPDIVCAMLGILRAGAAFVLLNPASPRLERERMLRRLSLPLAITDETLALETRAAVPKVLEFAEIARSRLTSARTPPAIRGTDLAYLVHTSGSTGEKKFVEIEHRSLANAVRALVEACGITPGERRISRATPGNDYFISEILNTLSGGGMIIFPERVGAMAVGEFDEMLRRERITFTGVPSSFWHEWMRSLDENSAEPLPPDLRLVLCGMERADPAMLAKWQRLAGPRIGWINAYGPAESTLISHIYRLDATEPNSNQIPIGRPIANTEAYVLDAQRRKLPVGFIGEIAIAGLGVARGYRDDEEATRKKFVENPHARSNEFSRLYLTGDYGYIDRCGRFVFVGRRDEQIKLSGHRIELGEVEAALRQHASVREAVVTVENADHLVAHILPNEQLDSEKLRVWIQENLSPHLRPADLVVIERIPIMPTGKVNRRALSAAYQARTKSPNECKIENPAGTEGKLSALWNELFGHRRSIARTDSFFHLGGNSLLAVRMLARVESELGARLSVHDLFTHPTIAGLAAFIDRRETKNDFVSLIKMNEGGNGSPLFIVHGWSGGVFHCLEFARRLEGTRPVFGLQAVELAGLPRHESVEEMAAHYADELTRAHPGLTYQLLGHSLGGMIAYATGCELLRRGEKVAPLYIVDTLPSNLPRDVHVQRVRAELRPRVLPHLRTMLQTWPRYWYRFYRARKQSLESRLRKWPSRHNPERKALRPDADYYYAVTREYEPPVADLEIKLFTPSDRFPTEIYWRYLTNGCVTNYRLTSGHIDMFEGANLENFLRAFKQASADARMPQSDNARPADNFRANSRAARNGHRDKTPA